MMEYLYIPFTQLFFKLFVAVTLLVDWLKKLVDCISHFCMKVRVYSVKNIFSKQFEHSLTNLLH